MRAAAGLGLLGVTIPTAWGGAGRDYVSYALAIEAVAGRARPWPRRCRDQFARRRGHRPRRDAIGRRNGGCAKLAAGEAIGAFALSEPDAGTDAANQQTKAVKAGSGYRISGRKVWVANAEEAVACRAIVRSHSAPRAPGSGSRAGGHRVSRPDGHAGHHAHGARDESLGVRGLGCMDLDFDIARRRRSGARRGGPGVPPRDVGAAGRPRGDCRAGARHRRGGARRGHRAREAARAVRPADRELPGDPVDAGGHRRPSWRPRAC